MIRRQIRQQLLESGGWLWLGDIQSRGQETYSNNSCQFMDSLLTEPLDVSA